MHVKFAPQAWEDYQYWKATNAKTSAHIDRLIDNARRTPFQGLGKPEPLKGPLQGFWSRRVTETDRLVYRISGSVPNQVLEIAQLRYHY
jgi:toxin YoeB